MVAINKIDTVKRLSGETDNIEVQLYLDIASQAIIDRRYPFVSDRSELTMPEEYDLLQCQIASFLLDKRGATGQEQHNENGIQRKYEGASISDVPSSLLSSVVPLVGNI